MTAVVHGGIGNLTPILALAAFIVLVVYLYLRRTVEPWTRRNPTPRRQLDNDRELVKIDRLRRRHRHIAFPEPVLPKVEAEQQGMGPEVEQRIVDAVVDRIAAPKLEGEEP